MAYFSRFTLDKIGARLTEIRDAVVRHRLPLMFLLNKEREDGWAAVEYDDSLWTPFELSDSFSGREQTVYLRATFTIPDAWEGLRLGAGLVLTTNRLVEGRLAGDREGIAEVMVYHNGVPLQAVDSYHREFFLGERALPGEDHTIGAAAYIGLGNSFTDTDSMTGSVSLVRLKTAEMRAIDRNAYDLYYDMEAAYQSAKTMDVNSRIYMRLIGILDDVTDIIDFRAGKGERFYESLKEARDFLRQDLYQKYHADSAFSPILWAVGHAHIDTAWLWRLDHTKKKCENTFSTALHFMEVYPDYKFSCSQAQQYLFIKEGNPALYERIKAAVAEGKWEPVGGMWVESDCNIVSGESLVRQFLYGVRFFEREFGKRTEVVWLPDVFGYSASLPQIIRKSGLKYFVTIKIAWSQVNKPVYHTFEWEGIDGSVVLAHFAPQGDYNCIFTPGQIKESWDRYQQKHISDSAMYIYGHGDGGGGPSSRMLEIGERIKDFPGMPKVRFSTAEEFFQDLEKQVQGNSELPKWAGELYLEYHRGTYTSQAWIKKANRQSEIGLQIAEQLSSIAYLMKGWPYPHESLNHLWQLVLLNQFHDIVTGSSIHEVYDDAREAYAEVSEKLEAHVGQALSAMAGEGESVAGRKSILLYNPLSWLRHGPQKLPRSAEVPGQPVKDLDGTEHTLATIHGLPPLGYATIPVDSLPGQDDATDLSVDVKALENRFFRIQLDENGEIRSVWHKQGQREVIDQHNYCRGNALLAFEDKPLKHDAWDIDIFYREKVERVQRLENIEVVEEGPFRAGVEVRRTFGRGSVVRQRILVYRDLARIDFETEVEWKERQTLLKAAFPVKVYSRHATYDIQFGNLERPTHWNTTWDWARFEVYGHKWADLSEGDYGVSILTDSKYGWDIKGNVMRLTLLKGPIVPDPVSDLGTHYFTYSLFPHLGDWRMARTVRRAYELNVPVQSVGVRGEGEPPFKFSFAEVDRRNLIIETLKKAEDEEAFIVRLYESQGQRGRASIRFGLPISSISEVNLLEEYEGGTITGYDADTVTFDYRPYELKSFKVTF